MGLMIGSAKYFYSLCKRHRLSGELLNLGYQRILVTPEQAERNSALPRLDYTNSVNQEHHSRWNRFYVRSEAFFSGCGFKSVDYLDVSAYEGANITLDLNSKATPEELHDRYDVIFDGSTLEHVFSPVDALAHLVRMLRMGGVVIHMSPTNNLPMDGFYQFSPNFFREFYAVNGFETLSFELHQFKVDGDGPGRGSENFGIFETLDTFRTSGLVQDEADSFVSPPLRGESAVPTQIFAVFRKIKYADKISIPYQARYADKTYWREAL